MAEELNEDELLNSKLGRADVPLKEYNMMRDTLIKLLETTKTHQEFIKEFRLSLLNIIRLAETKGIDLTPMYDYYQNLDFKKIEEMDLIERGPDPVNKKPYWLLTLKIEEDEQKDLNSLTR